MSSRERAPGTHVARGPHRPRPVATIGTMPQGPTAGLPSAKPTAVIPLVAESGQDGAPLTPPEPGTIARRRGVRRTLLVSLVVVSVLLGGGLLGAGLYLRSVESGVNRVNAFDDVPAETRPEKIAADALNVLVLGSDSRDPDASGSRADTIILAHLTKDRTSAQLISIPRDSWVYVPSSKDGLHGNREAKINAAFAWGGLSLMVQTVENYTKVRIDHVVMVDFSGFQEIVDALGGVQIDVDQSFTSTHALTPDGRRNFVKGSQLMSGAMALDYARERYVFADGDFTRIKHQQQVIKAILDKAASGGLLGSPTRLDSFLRATADAVSVDETLPLFDMVLQLRHLRSDDLTFLTNPTKGTGRMGTESVVLVDAERTKALYDAVRSDDAGAIRNAAKK